MTLTDERFAELIELKGWEWILDNVNPDDLVNAALGEALMDAQDAFDALVRIAPRMGDSDEDEEFSDFDEIDHDVDPDSLFDESVLD